MKPLRNELIRTSGQLKVGQIKKYLIKKLHMTESNPNVSQHKDTIYTHCITTYDLPSHWNIHQTPQIDVLYNGDPLGDELSLIFIQRTRWHHPTQDLCLHYCFGEDGAY